MREAAASHVSTVREWMQPLPSLQGCPVTAGICMWRIRKCHPSGGLTCSRTAGLRLVAGSRDLFGFGLKDGKGPAALFQHPLGVLAYDNYIFVADTYNNAIRRIDSSGAVETILKGGPSARRHAV